MVVCVNKLLIISFMYWIVLSYLLLGIIEEKKRVILVI